MITTQRLPSAHGPAPIPATPVVGAPGREPEWGQAMVEFAAVILPLVFILAGIIQFGFIFAAYVGVSNSAREAGRAGTIYEYDANQGQGQNDLMRCQAILAAAQQSLDVGVPGQFSGTCAAVTGGGDLAIAYPDSGTCTGSSRTGCQLRVTLTYRQPILVPLVGTLLSSDGSNSIALRANVTMVLN
ncbi:MAG: pilus assembly protein [Chloroflexi bacterium]|nr:pilus assembly protein [Chloroflexota bacterium]